MPDEVVIRVQGVGVRYGTRLLRNRTLYRALSAGILKRTGANFDVPWALRDISFEVSRGDVLGVIGPNGAGKSTLLLALAGLLRPEEGTIHTYGGAPTLLTRGGELQPDLTGRQNIYLSAAYHGVPSNVIAARVDEIVEFSDLSAHVDMPVTRYSSGMRSRLAFSILVHMEPDILLLDDLFGAGDARFKGKSRAKLNSMLSKARAIVASVQNIAFLRESCTKVLWLDGGRMVQVGEPREVIRAYRAKMREAEEEGEEAAEREEAVAEGLLPGMAEQPLARDEGAGIVAPPPSTAAPPAVP